MTPGCRDGSGHHLDRLKQIRRQSRASERHSRAASSARHPLSIATSRTSREDFVNRNLRGLNMPFLSPDAAVPD